MIASFSNWCDSLLEPFEGLSSSMRRALSAGVWLIFTVHHAHSFISSQTSPSSTRSTMIPNAAGGGGFAKASQKPDGKLGKKKVLGRDSSSKSVPTRQPKDWDVSCGCGSGEKYSKCCGRFHLQHQQRGSRSSKPEIVATPEELVRSRFTAYKYRLPEYLVSTSWKFALEVNGGGVAGRVFEKSKVNELKRSVKEEQAELLKFIDSYDFEDLEIVEAAAPLPSIDADITDVCSVAFRCNLKARSGGAIRTPSGQLESSNFLSDNVVKFSEKSTFRRSKTSGRWYYEDGEVGYEGKTLDERFDSEERQNAIVKQKAKMNRGKGK